MSKCKYVERTSSAAPSSKSERPKLVKSRLERVMEKDEATEDGLMSVEKNSPGDHQDDDKTRRVAHLR